MDQKWKKSIAEIATTLNLLLDAMAVEIYSVQVIFMLLNKTRIFPRQIIGTYRVGTWSYVKKKCRSYK